nr:unnamed protein product [Callosobruchus analis]
MKGQSASASIAGSSSEESVDANSSNNDERKRKRGFIAVTDCCAAGLKTVILNLTKKYGIDLTKCRGQGYDRANVMLGVYGGLQTLIKEHAPNADYVHCAAHALNLVLNDAARHYINRHSKKKKQKGASRTFTKSNCSEAMNK